ncbi:transcriptional regulator Medusa [Talaromyces islandicus]|uniref:Transcriptional regulator Medusa n=1 Tax=Talaromyces islandicus TaxID=28573 RepID=A0A0U1M8C9_TALIS|nr:transcriptional regulator Medusa [Talaromyces islandicus]
MNTRALHRPALHPLSERVPQKSRLRVNLVNHYLARKCFRVPLASSLLPRVQFNSDFQTPLIFDESADYSDPEDSRFAGAFSDGLLAKADVTLSMSGFGKTPYRGSGGKFVTLINFGLGSNSPDKDFNDPMHALPDNAFYSQASYLPELYAPSQEDLGSPDTDNLHYAPPQGYAGSSYGDAHSPLMDSAAICTPEVVSFSPQRGSENGEVCVRVLSPFDLHSTARAIFLSFGSRQCECSVNVLSTQSSSFDYTFSAKVPTFALTMSSSFDVSLQLVIDIPAASSPIMLQVGVFTYEQYLQLPIDDSRKRSLSSFENGTLRPAKRHSAHEVETKPEYPTHARSASYSPFMHTPVTTGTIPTQYKSGHSPSVSYDFLVPPSSVSYTTSLQATSPVSPSWSPSTSVASTAAPGVAISSQSQNPTLIRTSTLQQGHGLGPSPAFNPYAMYPTKAVLKLNGDLDSMATGWSDEEKTAQRRLVQFTRSQNGSTINADFKPISPQERTPNSICISCIAWEGKDECFVTSVDTIYLLESLVAVRFTVEEKNRIRRNLEGFRPLTVSKTKADSEEFFKVIMGFPAPKPRNIEKDVKVFPWKILSLALKKIIGKYSASYSSTAGALSATLSASHSMGSDIGTESQNPSSPQSVSESTTSSVYPSNFTSTALSPALVQTTSSFSSDFSNLAVSSADYSTMQTGYGYETTFQPHPMMANEPSWDFGSSSNPEDYDLSSTIPYTMA